MLQIAISMLLRAGLTASAAAEIPDPYTLKHVIGRGKFGEVKNAVNSQGDQVAVKIVPYETDQDKQRFNHEVRMMQQLHHTNIIRKVDQLVKDGHGYIYMEVCKGGDLSYQILHRRISESISRTIMRQLLTALAYMH